jgi:hypothetical protein
MHPESRQAGAVASGFLTATLFCLPFLIQRRRALESLRREPLQQFHVVAFNQVRQ